MKSTITFIPIGGLANRFFAIASAISFCQDHNVRLRVIWFKDWGMGASFNSIMELSQHFPDVEIIDARWKDYIFDRPRKRNLWLPFLFQRFYFGERVYERDIRTEKFSVSNLEKSVLNYKSIYLVQYHYFYPMKKVSQILKPNSFIQNLIEKRKINLKLDENMIGIHIRRTDHAFSIDNSPIDLFVSKMEEEILKDPSVRFYVASDDLDEKRKLKEIFGERLVSIFELVRRDNKQGIIDAVVELYTLASMKKIYGSCNSSYSWLAAHLSEIDLEYVKM